MRLKMLVYGFILILLISFSKNSFSASLNEEMHYLKKIVNQVHKSIRYGVGKNDLIFSDEIIKFGEGHCGHYSWLLLRELIKKGYTGEIVSITTYNHRNHSLVQVVRKFDKKKILLDATTNLVYKYSVEEIIQNPNLSTATLGRSKYPAYSNYDFWSSVKTITYIPYIGNKTIKAIKKVYSTEPQIFYKKPNDIYASFDYDFRTYTATKKGSSKEVNVTVLFEKRKRLSSLVIVPYDTNNYPSKVKFICFNKMEKNLSLEKNLKPVRSLLVINFVDRVDCDTIEIIFSNFKGQNRLLIRDIYIYGK